MDKTQAADRSLALRLGAERYLLIALVSFALSVIAIRLFLVLTGYPQLGSATLHIAHVLWGGLLLFVGGLLPLVLANAWVYTLSAVLNGVGMGLFIDEIGKFITQTNDYFYPPAAPIIYAFFLLVVLFYLYIRRSKPSSPRQAMYQALHDLGEVLDHDLQPNEKESLSARLQAVIQHSADTNLGRLAQSLLQFLETESLYLSQRPPATYERLNRWLRLLEDRVRHSWLTERRFRLLLASLLAVSAGVALAGLGQLIVALFLHGSLVAYLIEIMLNSDVQGFNALRFIVVRVILEGGLSLLLLGAVYLMLRGRQALGVRLATLSLVMSLTTVDLFIFYLDQFSATLTVLAQFGLLLLVLLYRKLYLKPQDSSQVPAL
jgi:hypothetical protein